jgi:hypothetical protein
VAHASKDKLGDGSVPLAHCAMMFQPLQRMTRITVLVVGFVLNAQVSPGDSLTTGLPILRQSIEEHR